MTPLARAAMLRAQLADARRRYDEIDAPVIAELHALKVQCPTCRCLVVPGEFCGCCERVTVPDAPEPA